MWRLIITAGVGIGALLIKVLSDSDESSENEIKKRIFISFAMKDVKYRDYLVSQAKNKRTPFTFIDMSVKKPWKEEEWQKKCRSKIKSCDGLIVLLSKKVWHSSGARWEIKCAREEGIPVFGMHIKKNDRGAIPPELKGMKIITWSWDNLANLINKI